MSDELEQQAPSQNQTWSPEVVIQAIELSIGSIKSIIAGIDSANRAAAKALWLSNSGGMAACILFATQITPHPWALVPLFIAMACFSWGIYLGVDMQVTPANRVTAYLVKLLGMAMPYLKSQSRPKGTEILQQITDLIPDVDGEMGAITENLVQSKRMFLWGTVLALIGVALTFAATELQTLLSQLGSGGAP
ncbi:MAG: hypothetical protein HWE25_08385 [Alphaproteobacteria bacterium]|nr:hypothetical protein [Alphaproteobacteria bacterium]